ncbi:MAG TPA: hypothetical protein VF752_14790, partial [Thermoleophilaceae bacterium]
MDIDEPSLGAARALQRALPGPSFVERSGGGNLHVWVFFSEPVEAYVASGVLAQAARETGVTVDVCPALDEWRATSHIKLPYHGDSRPMLDNAGRPVPLVTFLEACEGRRTNAAAWRASAQRLGLAPPRPARSGR